MLYPAELRAPERFRDFRLGSAARAADRPVSPARLRLKSIALTLLLAAGAAALTAQEGLTILPADCGPQPAPLAPLPRGETFMRAYIDRADVGTCGPGMQCVRAAGWAIHDLRQIRPTPMAAFYIDGNTYYGWGPGELAYRPDVCPWARASMGWVCGAVRSWDRDTFDWWGRAPSAGSTPMVGLTTQPGGVVVQPTVAPGWHDILIGLWVENPQGGEPIHQWSNAYRFCLPARR